MNKYIFFLAISCSLVGAVLNFSFDSTPKHCVFRALMNEDPVDRNEIDPNYEHIQGSVEQGLEWLKNAQQLNGGWGCGLHARQDVRDPHAVATDPATTAMVAMTLLRSGNTLNDGPYSKELSRATNYLLEILDKTNPSGSNITQLTGTQIQRKLGQNIDIVLTTQYLSNLLDYLSPNDPMYERVNEKLNLCVDKIQINQASNGSLKGGTWAGVLQSSLATSALESAQRKGAAVDEDKLNASKSYQQSNFNLETNEVSTADGAGIVLYSVSGSARASAQDAKKVKEIFAEAKELGRLEEEAPVSVENLIKSGLDEKEAMELNTAYKVYESAVVKAQRKDVMSGFGNNGGEEFLSFLQTGESLIISEDEGWTNWYDNISNTIVNIQNSDGSWNGHHCITSPVFCTATCVSLLTINNDIEKIRKGSVIAKK